MVGRRALWRVARRSPIRKRNPVFQDPARPQAVARLSGVHLRRLQTPAREGRTTGALSNPMRQNEKRNLTTTFRAEHGGDKLFRISGYAAVFNSPADIGGQFEEII